jgi:hypothetical protein
MCAFLNPENASLTLIQGMELVYRLKKKKIFDFRVNTPTTFPKLGSRKRFHASIMRTIDLTHKITPIWVIFSLKNFPVPKIFWSQQICSGPKNQKNVLTHPVKIYRNENLPWPVCRYLPNNLLVHNVS